MTNETHSNSPETGHFSMIAPIQRFVGQRSVPASDHCDAAIIESPLPPGPRLCMAGGMILLRHGQSEFNLHFSATRRDPGIVDPRLTDLGHGQAREAAQQLLGQGIERIIASPYTRALQTAGPVAAALGLPVTIDPIVRERFAFACDIGSSRGALERDWPMHDFSRIEDIWWPVEEESEPAIVDRAARFRGTLARRHDWANTLVVSHWGFILTLTGQSVANGRWLRCDPTEPAPELLVWRA